MSTDPGPERPTAIPDTDGRATGAAGPTDEVGAVAGTSDATTGTADSPAGRDDARPGLLTRIGADWAAVIVAAVLVLLAAVGGLPTIPFLVK